MPFSNFDLCRSRHCRYAAFVELASKLQSKNTCNCSRNPILGSIVRTALIRARASSTPIVNRCIKYAATIVALLDLPARLQKPVRRTNQTLRKFRRVLPMNKDLATVGNSVIDPLIRRSKVINQILVWIVVDGNNHAFEGF